MWDASVVSSSTTFPIYVQKVTDGPVVTIPNCVNYGGDHHDVADPSPCVEKRVRHSNGDVEAHVFLLSGASVGRVPSRTGISSPRYEVRRAQSGG